MKDSTEALRGQIDADYPLTSKIVRIFTSSTFTGKKCVQRSLLVADFVIFCSIMKIKLADIFVNRILYYNNDLDIVMGVFCPQIIVAINLWMY